jgi:polar amino acid transport system substrate-binding protein
MRTFLKAAAAAAVIALSGAFSASAEQVKVGFSPEAYPPFYQQDASGNWGGWEVEIVNAICSEAKLECVLTPIPWDGLIPALNSK